MAAHGFVDEVNIPELVARQQDTARRLHVFLPRKASVRHIEEGAPAQLRAGSLGPSLNKSKILPLVAGTGWNEYLELNRMAFDSVLPRNSESRAISLSIRLLKKYAPHVKWIVSFADACSCGDGTIYRASNFVLTGIKENLNLAELPDGTRVHKMTLASNPTSPRKELGGLTFFDVTGGTYNFKKYLDYVGATPIPGFQLRYIYFIDKSKRKDLTVPEIPFSKIDELGAGMYKGEKITFAERHSKVTPEE